jgi:hypothetical protein
MPCTRVICCAVRGFLWAALGPPLDIGDCLLAPVHALGLPEDRRVKTLPRPHRSPLCARAGQSPNIQRLHSRCSGRDDAAMPVPTRPQKITLAEMRAANVRGLLIYCSDYHCSHRTAISGDPWPDDVRLSDLEP